jgi:hypothetical protein
VRAAAGTRALSVAIVAAFSVAALAGFAVLVVHDPVSDLAEHLPGDDGRPAYLPPAPMVRINDGFEASDGVPSAITASWPGFRGPDHDNTSRETVALVAPGPGWQPDVLWRVDLGEGHAGAAVAAGDRASRSAAGRTRVARRSMGADGIRIGAARTRVPYALPAVRSDCRIVLHP